MLWFTEVDVSTVGWFQNSLRVLWTTLDWGVYGILGLTYQIFFNICSANIFSDNSIAKISQRIQLIIGVFVLFQLVMTIIRGIINPDGFTDSKSGAGNIIMRICTALIMLALLVPIDFSSTANEYQEKIEKNGILFGTLYSLQYRILNNNTIGQIITGVTPQENETQDEYFERTNSNQAKLNESANNFVVSILRGFYRINLREGELEKREGYEPGMIKGNRMCSGEKAFTDYIEKYAAVDATPRDILSNIDATCRVEGKKRYVFTYMPLASLIVGLLFVAIMLSFCYEIAMRAIKLGILQIIAPIPIISYMDPKGGKDGAFNAWIKLLISTYIDLFIRIATVYFAIFIIQEMLISGVEMTQGGIVGVLTKILIYIALFYFAKEAPKFIKQALGMKDDGGGMFSGLGKITGAGAAVAGLFSGGISGAASAAGNGKSIPGKIFRGLAGGIGGTVSGGWNAGKDLWNQQKPDAKAIMAANRARAAKNYAHAADKSTTFGRMWAGAQSDLGLQNKYDKLTNKTKAYDAAVAATERLKTALGADAAVKSARIEYEQAKARGDSGATLKRYKDAVDSAESSAYDRIKQYNDRSIKNASIADRQAYEAAKQVFEVGRAYANDDDKVFESYKNTDTLSQTNYDSLDKASKNAKGESDYIKNSGDYAKAKSNAERASDSKK